MMFYMLSGKRNHTGCCQRNSIPEHCLGFCAGEIPPINDNVADCMLKLPLIEACVKEGLGMYNSGIVNSFTVFVKLL